MLEQQPGARLFPALLSRPKHGSFFHGFIMSEDVPSAELRAYPLLPRRGQLGSDLTADGRLTQAAIPMQPLPSFEEEAIIGQEAAVKAGDSPHEAVGEIV
ncbi:MAG: hypothetical protein ACRD0K_19885 [Egibacteraceae bacterium]